VREDDVPVAEPANVYYERYYAANETISTQNCIHVA